MCFFLNVVVVLPHIFGYYDLMQAIYMTQIAIRSESYTTPASPTTKTGWSREKEIFPCILWCERIAAQFGKQIENTQKKHITISIYSINRIR